MPRMPASQPVRKLTKMGSQTEHVDLGLFEVHHGRDLDLVEGLVPLETGGQLVHLLRPAARASRSLRLFLATSAKTIQAIRARRTR